MKVPLVTFTLMAIANFATANCVSPTQWAESFYAKNYGFYYADPNTLRKVVTPELLKLLERDAKYSSNHTEVGALDYDPWLGAQDGDIGKPVNFAVESQSPDVAVISMSYQFVLEPDHPPSQHSVRLVLRKAGQTCWRLHDFITPLGEALSFVYSISKP